MSDFIPSSSILIPLAIGILIVLVFSTLFAFVKNCRLNVPTHMAYVISGRSGFRIVRGGGTFVIPILERADPLDLRAITIPDLIVKDGITKEGAQLTVKAVANIKIGSEDALLTNAAERLMGKTQDEIKRLAYETLEGHLRSILGTMTIEAVNGDRQAFQGRMINESQDDLARLGLRIDVLTVKELQDPSGYLDALGKTRVAQVKRDAEIGAAEAQREALIKSTTAHRLGQVEQQNNLAQEAEAEKDKNVRIQDYLANTNAAAAKAAQAGPLATAEARRVVVEKEQEVELTRTRKATEVAQAEQMRIEQELMAKVIRPAEAQKKASIEVAEGEAQAISIRAKAEKDRLIAEGEGKAKARELEMLAEANGSRAKFLAEAEGIDKKAEAYEKLDVAGRTLQILEAAQTLGPNMVREFASVMAATAKPLGEADKIVIVDSGSNGNGHGGAVDRFASIVPTMVFSMMEKLGAVGINASGLLKTAGVTTETDGQQPPKEAKEEKKK